MEHKRDAFANYETLHRLRTPLTVALLAASRLCRLVPLPDPAARLCRYLVTSLNQMRDELDVIEQRLYHDAQDQQESPQRLTGEKPSPADASP